MIGQLTALHGCVGVVRNHRIITSPNVPWVPDIQWQASQVGLCTDMRFGIDDYTHWPQWYHTKFPYLAAIPRPPSNGFTSPYACMWWTPSPTDFIMVEGCAADKRPGYLHKRFDKELFTLREGLLQDVYRILDELKDSHDFTHKSSAFGAASIFLRHAWLNLTSHAGKFEEKRLEVAEFQRAWLELKGMTNYVEWERAAMRNSGSSAPSHLKDCIGCVVDNPHVAMTMFHMGIPLWLVREKMDVLQGDVYIEQPTAQMMKPGDQGEVFSTFHDPTFPIIYTESPRHLLHYHVQHQYSRIRAVIQHASPTTGQIIYKEVPKWLMNQRSAASILVDVQTMRAQTSAAADHAAQLQSDPLSSAPSTSSSASSSKAKCQSKVKRHHPCKLPSFVPTSFQLKDPQMQVTVIRPALPERPRHRQSSTTSSWRRVVLGSPMLFSRGPMP